MSFAKALRVRLADAVTIRMVGNCARLTSAMYFALQQVLRFGAVFAPVRFFTRRILRPRGLHLPTEKVGRIVSDTSGGHPNGLRVAPPQ